MFFFFDQRYSRHELFLVNKFPFHLFDAPFLHIPKFEEYPFLENVFIPSYEYGSERHGFTGDLPSETGPNLFVARLGSEERIPQREPS